MKKAFILFSFIVIAFSSCDYRSIKGNGHVVTEQRNVTKATKVKLSGDYDVELTPASTTSLKLETDDNIMQYILTENEDGWLVIKVQPHIRLSMDKPVKVYLSTDLLEAVSLSGAGKIHSNGKFVGGDKFSLKISGSGNADVQVDAPSVEASVSGSGDIALAGAAKDVTVRISGNGKYKGEDMQSENAEIHISGSGDANVFAANKLDIHVSGSGDVKYKGNPEITKHISGSGSVTKIE